MSSTPSKLSSADEIVTLQSEFARHDPLLQSHLQFPFQFCRSLEKFWLGTELMSC
jgi:hypothetical protein